MTLEQLTKASGAIGMAFIVSVEQALAFAPTGKPRTANPVLQCSAHCRKAAATQLPSANTLGY